MCLIITKDSKVLIAEEDLVFYKVLNKITEEDFITPFYGKLVHLNELIVPKPKLFGLSTYCPAIDDEITGGLIHLLETEDDAKKEASWHKKYGRRENVAIVKAIIPKGTRYIRGYYSENMYSIGTEAVIYKEM